MEILVEELLKLSPSHYKEFYERHTKLLGDEVVLEQMTEQLRLDKLQLASDFESFLKEGEEVPYEDTSPGGVKMFTEPGHIYPNKDWSPHRHFRYVATNEYKEAEYIKRYLINPQIVTKVRDEFDLTDARKMGREAGIAGSQFSRIMYKHPVNTETFKKILEYFRTMMPNLSANSVCAGYVVATNHPAYDNGATS